MYQANLARAQAEQSFADYGEYLKSLRMTAVIRDFEPMYLQRITQADQQKQPVQCDDPPL